MDSEIAEHIATEHVSWMAKIQLDLKVITQIKGKKLSKQITNCHKIVTTDR